LYGIIEEILEEDGKGKNTTIMGDWNNVVGDESYRNIAGPHGLGRKNCRGQMKWSRCCLVILTIELYTLLNDL